MTKQYFKTLSGEVFSANVEGGQIDGRKLNPTKPLEELPGKTIKSAALYDQETGVCLIFDDGTYAAIRAINGGDYCELVTEEIRGSYERMEAGLISEAEYEAARAEENKEADAATKARELLLFAQLKAKYEGDA